MLTNHKNLEAQVASNNGTPSLSPLAPAPLSALADLIGFHFIADTDIARRES